MVPPLFFDMRPMESLFENKSIIFHSFQVGDETNGLDAYISRHANVHSLKPFIRDWQDTAYFLSKMDLFVSIDSGIGHLVAALGKPVWMILPKAAEWRWLTGKRDTAWFNKSPWYPTIRLFRSPSFQSWDTIIEKVKIEMSNAVVGQC